MAIRGGSNPRHIWLKGLTLGGALLAIAGFATAAQPDRTANAMSISADTSALGSQATINITWTIFAAFLVMFMQAGFALVGTGLCRAKNAAHTMAMNFMVYSLGMIGFFICGYAFMCGGANGTLGSAPALHSMFKIGDWGIIGTKGFFLTGGPHSAQSLAWFLFRMVFVITAATIPTGALAERWTFKSFFIFSILIGAVIYPVYACWVWGGGWLAQLGRLAHLGHGVVDYAGSSVVHLQGGAIALVLAWMLGPRIGKFKDGKPQPILPHHIPMVMLGTIILAFGWFGFNAGSSLAAGDGRIGIVAVNTMLASAFGAFTSCLYMWVMHEAKKPDPSMMCNGVLAGLVAITAPCAFVAPWAACLIGALAGVLVVWSVFFWEKRGIDDPVGAISVHGVNGAFGALCVGLFADGSYGEGLNGVNGAVTGLFYGGGFKQLAAQLIAVGVCIAWSMLAGGVIFWLIGRIVGGNRVPAEVEISGLDIPEMGIPGYPEFGAGASSFPEQFAIPRVGDSSFFR